MPGLWPISQFPARCSGTISGVIDEELQFLELSLPVTDVQKSLEWYRELGFIELNTSEVRQYPYAVVGDGEFCIGLHGDQLNAPGITFVRPELAGYVRTCEQSGQEFDQVALGIDDFHEALQSDPDGLQAILVEARSFSPGHDADHCVLAGKLASILLPCINVDDSLAFWQRFGFMAVESDDHEHAELHAPGMIIELHNGSRHLTLRFQPDDYDVAVATLNSTHDLKMFRENDLKGVELVAPEGTRIQLLQQ
jgi:catechol 2,3-dioxygenase-like lactoylglutathione lyase family enzyme